MRYIRRRDEVPVAELQRRRAPLRRAIFVIVILAIGVYFGFTKHIPFTHGYRLHAVFPNAVNISPNSPVRTAGVNVGKVTSVKRVGEYGEVTMEISNSGLPIHRDATVKIRPRLFLEGNWFVELQPGSPGSPTVSSGSTLPVTQASDPVQLDQVLDALNTDTRANLQEFLIQFGKAYSEKPTPAEDAEQEPEVQGLTGAQALNRAARRGPKALKGAAIVNQAIAGTHERDLSTLIDSIKRVTGALDVHSQALGELFTNFNTFLSEFANQSSNLRATVARLPGALHSATRAFVALGAALPPLRSFSEAIIPGVELDPRDRLGVPALDRADARLARADRARGPREEPARKRAADRAAHQPVDPLLPAERPAQPVPHERAHPRGQHAAAGRLQHQRPGRVPRILVLDGRREQPRPELHRQRPRGVPQPDRRWRLHAVREARRRSSAPRRRRSSTS